MRSTFESALLIFCWGLSALSASGGYDHGTATGRGQLELDLTWNPFDYFNDGQSYAMLGYGITDRLDFHGYFSHHPSGLDNYYYGLFYQFVQTKWLDLATAIGIRQYRQKAPVHLFFPQLLYNVKMGRGYTIGGSVVTIQTIENDRHGRLGNAFDVAFFVPITRMIRVPDWVEEVKVGIGAFRPGIYTPVSGPFLPTYSVDIKFGLPLKHKRERESRRARIVKE